MAALLENKCPQIQWCRVVITLSTQTLLASSAVFGFHPVGYLQDYLVTTQGSWVVAACNPECSLSTQAPGREPYHQIEVSTNDRANISFFHCSGPD